MMADKINQLRESIDDEFQEMARANDQIDQMITRYTGNFDILDDPTALDHFLELLVVSLGSDVAQLTPDDLIVNEGAGMIMRRDVDSVAIGVDEDVPPNGLIVPVYDGIREFFSTIDRVVVGGKKEQFEVPVLEYYLDPKTKPSKRDDIDKLVTAFDNKRCVFVRPPGNFENSLQRNSISFYSDLDECLSKYHPSTTLLVFDLSKKEYMSIVSRGVRVVLFRYSPFLPISVRYTKNLDVRKNSVVGTYFASRKYVKFKNWYPPDGIMRYTPTFWAHWLGIPISSVHIELLSYEVLANFQLPYTRESLFSPYLVDVGGHSSDCVLPPGTYVGNNVSCPITIGPKDVYYLAKLQVIDIINNGKRGLTIRGKFRGREYKFDTVGQYPLSDSFFHFNGNYYLSISNLVLGDCQRLELYPVSCSIAMGYSNIKLTLVRGVIAISPLSLAYTYHKVGRMAYEHQVMGEYDVSTDVEYDNYVFDLVSFSPPPLDG